jgi:phosphatidate cytidylyltransferase
VASQGLLLASHDGVRLLLGVALCVIAYDVFGFFVGSQFGHTPVAPRISPNKTIEGTAAGMIASIIVGAAIVGQIAPWTVGKGAVLGVLVAIGAFIGDLSESMLKRDLGLKDLGSLLPVTGECSTGSTRCSSACRSPTTSPSSSRSSERATTELTDSARRLNG